MRPDRRLQKHRWPELHSVETPDIRPDDGLVVCAGFEERAVEVARLVSSAKLRPRVVLLVRYLPQNDENRLEKMRTIFRTLGANVIEMVYDRERPMGGGERIQAQLDGCRRVFVDISGMSRLLIVQTLVALLRGPFDVTSVLYCEAARYLPSEAECVAAMKKSGGRALSYLSSGVVEVAVTPELSSVAMPGEAVRLIAFPSFDPTQLVNVVHELQPTYSDVMHGVPPREENRWRTGAVRELNGKALAALQGATSYEISTMDYRETLQVLTSIYSERGAFDRLVIAPIGSKMQSVAVALFRATLSDVQIVYPVPQEFATAEEYTVGIRCVHQVDFGPRRSVGQSVPDAS